jgi:isoquinoline 1-oxidoreductase
MNTHVKITQDKPLGEPADLSRRTFLVGSAAAGLVLGYSAVPGFLGTDEAFAATSSFDPSVWYSIAPDGIVTVTCGKADMGQHIASTMAQIICEELGANWKDMRVQLASNDPKFNDPVLGAQVTGGSWSTMMNFDAMSRAGAAGRIALTEAAGAAMGLPPFFKDELIVRDSVVSHPKTKKSMTFADIVKSGKATKTFTPDELKAIKLKTADQYTVIGVSVPQLDIPSKTNGTAKFGIDVMLPGMVYGKVVTPPVRYGATVKSVDDSDAKKVPGFIKAVVLDDKTTTTTGWVVVWPTPMPAPVRRLMRSRSPMTAARTPSCRANPCSPKPSGCRGLTTPACSSSRTAIRPRPSVRRRRCWKRNTPPALTSMRRWSR